MIPFQFHQRLEQTTESRAATMEKHSLVSLRNAENVTRLFRRAPLDVPQHYHRSLGVGELIHSAGQALPKLP